MTGEAWHVHGRRVLPARELVEWWVDSAGILRDAPVPGAAELPGDWVLEGGMVDAHAHVTFEPHPQLGLRAGSPELLAAAARSLAAAGVLAARDAGSVPWVRPGALLGRREGVDVTGCGPFLAPAGGFLAGLHEPVAPADAPAAAAARIRAGWPWAKVILDYPGEDFDPLRPRLGYEGAVLREIAAAVHGEGGRLAVHVMGDVVDLAIEAGVDSIEHGVWADPDAVREMAARGIAWVPTLSTVAERYLEPVSAQVPVARAILEQVRAALPVAAQAGVAVLAGTDEEPYGSVAREIAALHRYGLPADAAVRAGSSAGHALLGSAPLRAGEPAALVTFAADPVADVATLARPVAVLAGGTRVV